MAIATKTLYQTEDGKEFETELEAKAHETALQNDAEIEALQAVRDWVSTLLDYTPAH